MLLWSTQAQSLVNIWWDVALNTISNPMPKEQCLEPGNIVVSKDKHFYFWDTYTTRELVPKRGNWYDTIILSKSNVLVYNQSLFGFTTPIKWKSNWIPNSATVSSTLAAEWTFKVSSKTKWQLVYNTYRSALSNQWNTSFNLSYLWRPDLKNYTANLTNKTFYDKAGRVVNWYECVNYFVHYCWDWKKDTQSSIASLEWWVSNSIANEECDWTDWTPAWYTCNAECKLVAPAKKVDLSLTKTVNKPVVLSWEEVVFTIIVRNDWQENATNVEVTDLLPSAYIYVSNTVSQWSYNTTNWVRTVWSINVWTSKTLTLTAKVKNVWNYLNIAEVTKCTEEDIDSTPNNHVSTEDDQDSASVSLTKTPTEINIEKILIKDVQYSSGDLVWFRIDFVNKGPWIAHNVIITDYIPDTLIYMGSRIVMDDANIAPILEKTIVDKIETIIYRGFDLNEWKGWYIILTWMVKWYGWADHINNVFIKSDEDDDNAWAEFRVYTETTVLTINKTINKSIFNLWEILNFTIAVTNNWPTTINWLRVEDIRPDSNCIKYTNSASDHNLTRIGSSYARTYDQTFNIWETIKIYITWYVANDVNCVKSYLNTWTLTYNILWNTRYLRSVVPFSVVNQDNQCKSISVSKSIIELDSNDRWSTQVSCQTNGWNWNMEINCWNGKTYSLSNVNSINYTCVYDDSSTPKNYDISCKVNGTTNSNCETSILVDKGSRGWYCGNGKLDSFESCDITSAKRAYDWGKKHNWYYIIWERADNGYNEISSKYDNWEYYCKNCWIKELPNTEVKYTPVACFNTQTTISIQQWEYLPFRRNLEDVDNIVNWDDCDDWDEGKILKDSLKCNFKVYNWKNSDSDEDEIYKITKDCDIDERDNHKLFKYFENSNIYRSLDDAFWKYYLEAKNFVKDWVYWEYKLALDSVKYDYCDENNDKKEWITVERVCEVDFAVTKPYIAQKSTFSIKPQSTNINLKGFFDIEWNELINKTDLKDIMILDEWKYNASNNIYTSMTNFTKKYEKLAIKVNESAASHLIESNPWVKVSKVPNQQIYIFEWNGTIKLKEQWSTTKPFTMIVKWLNLIVKWNIEKTNWMFLVDWWTISFEESDGDNRCKKTQTVQWIFVTNKWFYANNNNIYQKTANDDLDNPRCVFGGLKVKWVLIWNNIESIILSRRSQLNHRFTVSSAAESAVRIERRNEVFNWASLLIEYSPSLWETLPPGANEFTKLLEVYKK